MCIVKLNWGGGFDISFFSGIMKLNCEIRSRVITASMLFLLFYVQQFGIMLLQFNVHALPHYILLLFMLFSITFQSCLKQQILVLNQFIKSNLFNGLMRHKNEKYDTKLSRCDETGVCHIHGSI